jgi:hypothetical protein
VPATAPNHRLLAREHLAEATALADEGHLDDCRASLLGAAGHAIGQLAADHSLDAPSISRAMAVLSLRGILPFDARPLWHALQTEHDGESQRRPPSPLDTVEAIRAVQSLVDLAAGVPGPRVGPATWQRWGAPPEDADDSGGEPLPVRATGWVRAVARDRARRRGRRARRVSATAACAVGLALVGLAWSDAVDGTEYRPAKADIGFYDSGS